MKCQKMTDVNFLKFPFCYHVNKVYPSAKQYHSGSFEYQPFLKIYGNWFKFFLLNPILNEIPVKIATFSHNWALLGCVFGFKKATT